MTPEVFKRISQLMVDIGTNEAHAIDLDGTFIEKNFLESITREIIENENKAPPKKHQSLDTDPFCDASAELPQYIKDEFFPKSILTLLDKGFYNGRPVQEVLEHALYKAHDTIQSVYPIPRLMVHAMRRSAYRKLIICITGTPQEIADVLANVLGFDVAIGCAYPKINGVYDKTKPRDLRPGNSKGEVMDEISEKCGLVWSNGVAMGNTRFDIEMLEKAGYPFAVNPNPALQNFVRMAKSETWHHGRVTWIDQGRAGALMPYYAWMPDKDGYLEQRLIADSLPKDIADAFTLLLSKEKPNG